MRRSDAPWRAPTVSSVSGSFDATAGSLLVRTDFSDEEAWGTLLADACRPYGPDGFMAYFVPVSIRAYEGMGVDELANVDGGAHVVYAADRAAMLGPDRTLLVIDRLHNRGRWFRCTLDVAWSVENNLSLFNMDFFEFAAAVDDGGVFTGFERRV